MIEKIKNDAPELQEVADQEGMNVMNLFNNIAGTLRTVSIEQTAVIYAVSKSVVEFVSENIDLAYSKKLIDEIDSLYPYHIQVAEDDTVDIS